MLSNKKYKISYGSRAEESWGFGVRAGAETRREFEGKLAICQEISFPQLIVAYC